MIIDTLLWYSLPLTVLAVVLCCRAALLLKRTQVPPRKLLALAQVALVLMWLGSCVFAALARQGTRDWTHLSWSAHDPMMGLFAGAGAFLCRTWRRDSEWIDGPYALSEMGSGPVRRRLSGAWIFFAMMASLALLPLPLQIAMPEDRPTPWETGNPMGALGEVIAWGFGGPLPAVFERGSLPREVTVPLATTSVGLWFWLAFCALAFIGRCVRSQHKRLMLYLLAPPIAIFALCFAAICWVFNPVQALWDHDLSAIRSYGPALLAALLAAIALAVALKKERAPAARE